MDRVRFGRALGVGARAAAKSLLSAAEAAAAPGPVPITPASRKPPAPAPTPAPIVTPVAAQSVAAAPAPSRSAVPTATVVAAQAKNLKRSVWSPFAHFSRVLWLEVTGTFFGIFALMALQQVWKARGAVHLPPGAPEAQRLYVYVALLVLFGYFAASSFLRARRPRRR